MAYPRDPNAIYDDDPNALERLTEKLARLEAARDCIKRYNVTCRAGRPDTNLLSPQQRSYLASCLIHTRYNCPKEQMPQYVIGNLNGNIGRIRKRIERLSR